MIFQKLLEVVFGTIPSTFRMSAFDQQECFGDDLVGSNATGTGFEVGTLESDTEVEVVELLGQILDEILVASLGWMVKDSRQGKT